MLIIIIIIGLAETSNIWSQIFNISIVVIIIIDYHRSRREWDMNNIWAQMVFK